MRNIVCAVLVLGLGGCVAVPVFIDGMFTSTMKSKGSPDIETCPRVLAAVGATLDIAGGTAIALVPSDREHALAARIAGISLVTVDLIVGLAETYAFCKE